MPVRSSITRMRNGFSCACAGAANRLAATPSAIMLATNVLFIAVTLVDEFPSSNHVRYEGGCGIDAHWLCFFSCCREPSPDVLVLRGSLVCSSRKCGTTDPLSRGAGSGIWSVRYHWETVL